MDNQHRKIGGYRELDQETVDLMNEIKAKEAEVLALVRKVQSKHNDQRLHAQGLTAMGDQSEMNRLALAAPETWAQAAKMEIQTGFMKLIRAIAQPAPL